MSVSDPLLKLLKGHILSLLNEKTFVTDYTESLVSFCDVLEQIFRKGMKRQATLFGMSKKDYWSWIQDLLDIIPPQRLNPGLSYTVSAVRNCKQVKTVTGRGRLFFRYGLARKCIHLSLAYIRQIPQLQEEWYESSCSIIGNEILSEILLSLLKQTNEIRFQLNLENSSFLDESWLIPLRRRFEFVPTKLLGIRVRYVRGRAIACEIQEESPAALRNLEVADVLDQLFDIPLNGVSESKIPSILRDAQGIPIYLTVVKAHYIGDRVYPPIAERLREIGMRVDFIEADYRKQREGKEKIGAAVQKLKGSQGGYSVKYLGSAPIGTFGGVKMIEPGIIKVLSQLKTDPSSSKELLPTESTCTMNLTEGHVTCTGAGEEDLVCKHSYTEISSCGRRVSEPARFAYIAGDTTCTMSESFICYVFEASSATDAKDILQSIAQGFDRTHWLM